MTKALLPRGSTCKEESSGVVNGLGLLEYYEDEGAMNKRNNAMAGVGDGNRNAVNMPDIGPEFDEPNHSGLIDKLRWLRDLFGLPLLLEELDAMRTVGEDELLSNVAVDELPLLLEELGLGFFYY
ncbi:hypothetical protein Tco_1123961 [Tanacetum coccineum]|uniref:Uncharacterized protein n=1 Tax=Tanacetum coccineum TaxID=301880 RepID=A0ABQ5J5E6_9ASTR